jgi:transcriptional regulator with XRE-family HTH domain
MSSEKIEITGRQIAAARELLNLTQADLADAIGMFRQNLTKLETGKVAPRQRTLKKIRDVLERRGIEFTNGNGPGVRLNTAKAAEYAKAAHAAGARSPG